MLKLDVVFLVCNNLVCYNSAYDNLVCDNLVCCKLAYNNLVCDNLVYSRIRNRLQSFFFFFEILTLFSCLCQRYAENSIYNSRLMNLLLLPPLIIIEITNKINSTILYREAILSSLN